MKMENNGVARFARRGLGPIAILVVIDLALQCFAAPNVFDDFEGYGAGTTFVAPSNGWQASGITAYVTNSGGYVTNALAPSNSVFMGVGVALTNTLSVPAVNQVWTDMRISPVKGDQPDNTAPQSASFVSYFNSKGFLVVATTNSGWQTCTNDIWGNPVAPATNGYARVSLFQDYATSNQAVFLDDRLVLQDARFSGSAATYAALEIQNTDSNCWLDNVWIKTVAGPQSLTNDLNQDGSADAAEVAAYGHAARKLYVYAGTTNLVPGFTSITNAIAAWRPRDTIHVIAGNYSGESVTLAATPSNIVFEGDAFTVGNLTVASGATVSFAQSFACGTLTVSGQVALAGGASVTATTATVNGLLAVSTNGALVATSLAVVSSGVVSFTTNAQLVAIAAGVTMSGPLTLSNTWGSTGLVSMPLTFSDNFEPYAAGTVVTNLKFRGWYASSGAVTVQTNAGVANSKAVVLPDGTTLSNSISATGLGKVWTDLYLKPVWGLEPVNAPTNDSSFLAYVSSNGYLVVAVNGGWRVCSNAVNGQTVILDSNAFNRITVCLDLASGLFTVFAKSNMMAVSLSMPTNTGGYRSLSVSSSEGSATLDNPLISTLLPDGLTSDLDGNGIPDGYEINTYNWGDLARSGSIYTIR